MKRMCLLGVAVAAALGAPIASAQPKADPAAAQALFYEARNLMRDQKYAQACPKFEESLRLDYGIGTEFNLADCNERLGRIATAWSGFINVATAAKSQNQPSREKVARERAKALEPRLPRLSIDVPGAPPQGLEIRRDNVVLGSAAWGTSTPIDPGVHRIVASAPGRQNYQTQVTAIEGKTARIVIPTLAPTVTPQEPVAMVTTTSAETPATTYMEPDNKRDGSTQRTIGWVVGAIGVGALGVGAGFGIDSLQKRERSDDHCTGNACDETGVSLRDRAITSGNIATATTIGGAAAVLGGLVLVLTAPKSGPRHDAASRYRFAPHVATNGGGLSFQGVLP